jgi:hypothetical protein
MKFATVDITSSYLGGEVKRYESANVRWEQETRKLLIKTDTESEVIYHCIVDSIIDNYISFSGVTESKGACQVTATYL